MLDDLNPMIKVLFENAKEECEKKYKIEIVCVKRTKQEQMQLYCYGRTYDQSKKAGVADYILNIIYKNKNIENLPKKVYSLYSMHFEGRAIDIKTDNITPVLQIFSKYGFTVKKKSDNMIHIEIEGKFQNKFKRRLCTPELINIIKKCINNKFNISMELNGLWDLDLEKAILLYKENSHIAINKNELSINPAELNDILKYI